MRWADVWNGTPGGLVGFCCLRRCLVRRCCQARDDLEQLQGSATFEATFFTRLLKVGEKPLTVGVSQLGKLVLGMQNIHQGCFRVVLDGSLGLINWRQDWTETLALVMWVAEICGEANCFNGCVCQLHVLPQLWSKLRSRSVIEDRDERP